MPTHAIDTRLVLLSKIKLNPDQPRKNFDRAELESLKSSLKERGLINPVSLKETTPGNYLLIAGERRYRAAEELGWDLIDARIWPPELPQQELDLLALVENLQRIDLNCLEVAQGYRLLASPPYNMSLDRIADQVGLSDRSTISRYIALLDLPKEIQKMLSQDNFSEAHCRYITRISDPTAQIEFANRIVKEGWSAKRTSEEIEKVPGAKKAAKKAPKAEGQDSFKFAQIGEDVLIKVAGYLPAQATIDDFVGKLKEAYLTWRKSNP